MVQIDEIIVKGNPNLSELLHGSLSVQQIQIRGLHVRAMRGRDGQWDIATLWPLPQFTPPPAPLPEVILEKAQIELLDGSSRTTVG